MVMRYADPVETLFAFQRALRKSSFQRLAGEHHGRNGHLIHPSTCSSKEMT